MNTPLSCRSVSKKTKGERAMNSNELQGYVHNYVQNAPEVNLSEMLKTLRNDGVNITRPAALKALRKCGLEPYTGVSLNGERARLWHKCGEIEASEDADENEDVGESDATDDTTKPSKVESEISRVNASNEELLNEKQNLFDLVQKSVRLKKEIRAQQKQLLLEMSQLVQAMYGDSDAD
jgi:hypothetical protein